MRAQTLKTVSVLRRLLLRLSPVRVVEASARRASHGLSGISPIDDLRIAEAFMNLNKAVLYEGTVAEELKMLVSLIASQASGCRYCQAHMANLSSIYHASDEKIRAVWEFETSALFSAAERAALRLAYHAALVPNVASAKDFDELKRHFDEGQIVEIVATIALFGYLNRWNDTMATSLEDRALTVAQRAIGTVGWIPGKHAGGTA